MSSKPETDDVPRLDAPAQGGPSVGPAREKKPVREATATLEPVTEDGSAAEIEPATAPVPKPKRRRRSLRSRAPWLFRRGWVLVVVTIIVVAVAVAVSAGKQVTYSSDAILLVNPGASQSSPGSASDAQALAATYAGLIPNDAAVLNAVSSVTGLSQNAVKDATTVTVVNGTSLIDVRFTADSAATASLGATYISEAISGKSPVTSAIPSGTIKVVHGANTPKSHATKLVKVIALGVILGLLLAIVIVIIWERSDARLDKPEQITAMTGIPARSLGGLSPEAAATLVDRWRTLAFNDTPQVALVGAVPGIENATQRVGERLLTLTDGVSFTTAGAPGTDVGDSVPLHSDLTVLVVPREARVREVLRSKELLEQFGVRASWALMVNTQRL